MMNELQIISEKERIVDVINSLFINTDNRNWKEVRECFSGKVLFDMTSLTGGTASEVSPDEIIEGWNNGLKDLHAIHHQAGNYVVNISGKNADVFCYAIAYHFKEHPSGSNTRVFVGSYELKLELNNYAWKIYMFKFNCKFIDGNKNLTD